MKYGVIRHHYGADVKQFAGFNLGDPVQSIAVRQLYHKMGIAEQDIVSVDVCQLQTYDGDYLILPMSGICVGAYDAVKLPFSAHIIPLFLSCHIGIHNLSQGQLDYLRAYSPIGCRDEYTLTYLREHQIPAYLSGCLTITFPKREKKPNPGRVFLVDMPESLQSFLPSRLKEQACQMTHLYPFTHHPMQQEDAQAFYQMTQERLSLYEREASLMITSRLHAAVPCMAMGIPTIVAAENCSQRFSWLDRYLPIYTPQTFASIDWNPDPIEMEKPKQMVEELFFSQCAMLYERYKHAMDISLFYESRTKQVYGSRYVTALQTLTSVVPPDFSYVIWGCGVTGESTYLAMRQVFPKAVMVAAIDEFAQGSFHGKIIEKSEALVNYPQAFVLLANYAGREMGYDTMRRLGRQEGKEFLYLGSCNG